MFKNRCSFLTVGEFECDLAHLRSVAVLCMLYKIRCNPTHILHGVLPMPYVPVRVTPGARLGESDIHPISPKTPAPQYQPIDRKKRKGKRVEDNSRDRAA